MQSKFLLFVLSFVALPLCSAATTATSCNAPGSLTATMRSHPSAAAWAALGGWFGERQQYACAIPALQSAVQLDPRSARLHSTLGYSLMASGHAGQAVSELQRAVALAPRDVKAFLTLGLTLHSLHRTAEAEDAWQTALNIDPLNRTALDWLAKARIESGEFEEAIALLQSEPKDSESSLDLALAYSRSGSFDSAAETLLRALRSNPKDARLILALASVYSQAHRYDDATELLRKATTVYPRDSALLLEYLRLLVLQGNFSSARALVDRLRKEQSQDFELLYLSGVIANGEQNYTLAVQQLQAAVQQNPQHYDALFNLGIALLRLGQPQAARDALLRAEAIDTLAADVHFQLAQALRQLGDSAAAQSELKLFQERQQATLQLALGQSKAGQAAQALRNGQTDQAIQLYRDAVAAQPQNASFHFDLAQALGSSSRPSDRAEQRSELEKSIVLRPGFAAAENQLGLLAAQNGENANAEASFRNALRVRPSFAEAANNLGTLLGSLSRDTEAESFFRSAVSAKPNFAQAWLNLAATLAAEGRLDEAKSAAQNMHRIDPANREAVHLLQLLSQSTMVSTATKSPTNKVSR